MLDFLLFDCTSCFVLRGIALCYTIHKEKIFKKAKVKEVDND